MPVGHYMSFTLFPFTITVPVWVALFISVATLWFAGSERDTLERLTSDFRHVITQRDSHIEHRHWVLLLNTEPAASADCRRLAWRWNAVKSISVSYCRSAAQTEPRPQSRCYSELIKDLLGFHITQQLLKQQVCETRIIRFRSRKQTAGGAATGGEAECRTTSRLNNHQERNIFHIHHSQGRDPFN